MIKCFPSCLPQDLWKIIKDLNTNLTAKLKTKCGLTRKINIKDSIRQGGVLSVIQYSLTMDEINKEIQKHKLGPKFDNLQQSTGCLLWMDDSYHQILMNYKQC